jgi:hypothetical protein
MDAKTVRTCRFCRCYSRMEGDQLNVAITPVWVIFGSCSNTVRGYWTQLALTLNAKYLLRAFPTEPRPVQLPEFGKAEPVR